MSQPTDFEVVTWACENGWTRATGFRRGRRERCWEDPEEAFHYGDDALNEMRRQYAAAHRPPLAERIAEAVLRVAADEQPYPRKAPTTFVEQATEVGLTMKMVKAIQRVLDEEGETQ